jgi:hypothetical protein
MLIPWTIVWPAHQVDLVQHLVWLKPIRPKVQVQVRTAPHAMLANICHWPGKSSIILPIASLAGLANIYRIPVQPVKVNAKTAILGFTAMKLAENHPVQLLVYAAACKSTTIVFQLHQWN